VGFLKEQHKIEIQLNKKALDDAGVAADTPITRSLQGVTLRSALDLILRERSLTFVVQDEMLLITTPEDAETKLATVIYPVGDLVQYRDPSGGTMSDFDSLIELINSTIAPEAWSSVGGPGSVEAFPTNLSLVISQTQEVHRQVAGLLQTLRRAGGKELAKSEPPVRSRPQLPKQPGAPGMGMGGFGGMGGGGGGAFGGMTGSGRRQMGTSPGAPSAAPDESSDLLQGLEDANRRIRSKQAEKTKGRNVPSNGGMMGGMGGFGGGVGAGGAF
jgi:hypothetical protein